MGRRVAATGAYRAQVGRDIGTLPLDPSKRLRPEPASTLHHRAISSAIPSGQECLELVPVNEVCEQRCRLTREAEPRELLRRPPTDTCHLRRLVPFARATTRQLLCAGMIPR